MNGAEWLKWAQVFKVARRFTGTALQYVRGDGSLATFPVPSIATPSRALVSSATATGFQPSATRDVEVRYEGTFSTTTTIGGPSNIEILLETADTNSTTASDWTVIARQRTNNTATLAVVLQLVQIVPWLLARRIPAGKWVRIRYASVTGTASAAINAEQQEVTL